MLIRVIYLNGRYDMVKPACLDELIASMRISQFRRREGWVHLWRDRVRRGAAPPYPDRERRAARQ